MPTIWLPCSVLSDPRPDLSMGHVKSCVMLHKKHARFCEATHHVAIFIHRQLVFADIPNPLHSTSTWSPTFPTFYTKQRIWSTPLIVSLFVLRPTHSLLWFSKPCS